MKVKTGTLAGFLKKFSMEGSQQINEGVLRFEDEGLKISANSVSKQVRVMSWLKKGVFTEYEAIGNVGVNDIPTVIRVLERFGENISLTKEGNLLTVKGESKKVEIELVAESFLDTDTGEPTLEFIDTFTIPSAQMKNIYKDVKMNKDATLTIETADKSVAFKNTGKYKFLNTIAALTCKGGAKSTFGEPLIDATNNLDGELEISLGENYPMKVMEKTETSVVTIIVAPRVAEE